MEIVRQKENGANIEISTTTGIIISVDSSAEHLSAPAFGVKEKNIRGSILDIQVEGDGIDSVFFPRDFSPLELSSILDHQVTYSRRLWQFFEGFGTLNSYTYTLKGTNESNNEWEIEEEFTH